MARNEKKVQDLILTDLKWIGKYCECFKIMRANDNGIPDIFFTTKLTGGVFIECKRLKGAARKLQLLTIKNLNECGVKAFICHSWQEWSEVKISLEFTKENVISAHYME